MGLQGLVGGRTPSSWLLLLPVGALCSSLAQAAGEGELRGRVTLDGAPLPGATVTLSGAHLAGTRSAETDAEGRFLLVHLPAGAHELLVQRPGSPAVETRATVRPEAAVFLPIELVSGPAAALELRAASPRRIDPSRSAVSAVLSAEDLRRLPTHRSDQSAVNLIPGVYGRVDTQNGGPGSGNPSVRGEGAYGNNCALDGFPTRDPATKTFGSAVVFDAIESIQVYTDGAPAEFGQATGMMVNVITKDGADEPFGAASYHLGMDASPGQSAPRLNFETGQEEPGDPRDFMFHQLSVTAGGPIRKEKLWYMASIDASSSRMTFEGLGNDAPYGGPRLDGFWKLTWFAAPALSFQVQLSASYEQIDNYDTSGAFTADAQAQYTSTDLGPIFTARWRPSSSSELEFKAGYLPTALSVVPMSGREGVASIRDVDTGHTRGNWLDYDVNRRSRRGASLKFSQRLEHALGEHRLKTGVEQWALKDSRDLTFTGPGEGVEYLSSQAAGLPCTAAADYSDCYGYRQHDDVGELGHEGQVFAAFVQDDWSPVGPLTLNLGLRADHEVLYQNSGDRVLAQWMPAPRLGLAWDLTKDGKTLFALNWGRYYDINGNTFANLGDTRSAFVYREYRYDAGGAAGDGVYYPLYEQEPEVWPLVYCTDRSLNAYKERLADAGYSDATIQGEYDAAKRVCGDGLRPYHMDKLVVGLKRQLGGDLVVGLRGITSVTRDLPEDVDINLTTWVIANPASKRRDYRALELVIERPLDDRWQGSLAYTLSESRGTSPGQFELSSGAQTGSDGNGVSSFLDDISDPDTRALYYGAGSGRLMEGLHGLGYDGDDAGWYGDLPYDSRHQVKASGSYRFDLGTTLGLIYELDSGHAWQKRGYVGLYGDYVAFPEGRGSRHMPAVHYVDFRLAQEWALRKGQTVELSVDVFNLPDLEAPIAYYENDNEAFGAVLSFQSPRAAQLGLTWRY